MRRRRLLATAAVAPAAFAQPTPPLRVGIAPFLSPAALLQAFRPLREHLQAALAEPVEAVTARDFAAFAAAVRRTDYDLALLPAHLARVAVADWGWAPLARSLLATEVLVLVREGGPVADAAALRGGSVGMLDLLSLTAAVGTQWLRAEGLADSVQTVALPSINSAMHALARDEVAAVVAATAQLQSLPADTPQALRPIARLADIPGPWHVGRPGADAAQLGRWRDALLAFAPDPRRPASAPNAKLTPLTAADTAAVEPHAAFLRRQLGALR